MQLEWRRRQVFELSSKGYSQTEIAKTLQISESTICRDLDYLRDQSKSNVRQYIDKRLPEEYEKCLIGITAVLKEAWTTSQQAQDKREKIQALSLAKDCYSMKLDLLTNATVVDDAIRFVSEKSKERSSSSNCGSNEHDKEQSTESDYDESGDQPDKGQEEETGEIVSMAPTTNQVF